MARLFSEINEVSFSVVGREIKTPLGNFPVTQAPDGDRVILCIRQQGMRVSADPEAKGLSGRVLHVKFLGDDAWLDIGVEGFEQPLRVRTLHQNAFEQGTEVRVAFDLDKALVFTRPT